MNIRERCFHSLKAELRRYIGHLGHDVTRGNHVPFISAISSRENLVLVEFG